ncbi:MAG: hypothetical protein KGN16_24255 [Burkholderiales bacterium]|nr:hypothetical protein [Burkholderiales bacterium]
MSRRRWIVAALAVAALLGGAAAGLSRFMPIVTPMTAAEIDASARNTGLGDCFWVGVGTTGGLNYAYPDTGANYWISQFRLPPGAALDFTGEFPHARHLSFNAYNEGGKPVDRLNDVLIRPDAGAVNPFLVGSARDADRRGYGFHIVAADVEAGASMAQRDAARAVNTLYVPKGDTPVQLMMRIYVPDKGLTPKAGAMLPAPTLKMADGSRVHGQALCQRIVVKEGAARVPHLELAATRTLLSLEDRQSPYHPAQGQPRWESFFNPPYVLTRALVGTKFEWVRSLLSTKRSGGFYSTLDNTYMLLYVDDRYGDALVLRGKAPTTPRTVDGERRTDAGQLRYWSLCKYRSLNDTRVDGCLYDEQIPLDRDGNYTIVVSTAAHRPANASRACGVAWLAWGAGDGIANAHGGFLLYRHMLPAEGFEQSLFATRQPGDEPRTLGPYYPDTRYSSKAAFERSGCAR